MGDRDLERAMEALLREELGQDAGASPAQTLRQEKVRRRIAEARQAEADAKQKLAQAAEDARREDYVRSLRVSPAPDTEDDLDAILEWKPRHLELREKGLKILAELGNRISSPSLSADLNARRGELVEEVAGVLNELAALAGKEDPPGD